MPAQLMDLKTLARELLASGKADVILGYRRGQDPLSVTPIFVRDAKDADLLVFDRTCEINLANYLPRLAGRKVAIVVKGCDERSVIGLIQERQVKRENLIIIGAPCAGVVNRKRVMAAVGGAAISDARIESDSLAVQSGGRKTTCRMEEVIYAGCRECAVRNPRFADYLIGEAVPQPEVPEFSPEVGTAEGESTDQRWQRFSREMSKCILCFACRNLCPACYCRECFVDSTQPRWTGKTEDPSDIMFFHLTRLLHLAGRCTGCGACVRGCPAEVNLRLYNDKLRREAKDVFDFQAGMDPEAKPPLACFRPDDKNDFIR